jgi:hypothetical protein
MGTFKASPPARNLPPYEGVIAPDSLRAVVTRADPKIKPATIERLKKSTGEIRRLVQAQEALSVESVRQAHRASIDSSVASIRKGAAPETINNVQDVSSIAAEYSAKRQALREAQGSVAVDTLDDLEDAGDAIITAVDELALATENAERAEAEGFHVEFRPSQQLLLIRSVGFLIKQRFNGIREVITRDSVHAGSPATMLHDLLPEATSW